MSSLPNSFSQVTRAKEDKFWEKQLFMVKLARELWASETRELYSHDFAGILGKICAAIVFGQVTEQHPSPAIYQPSGFPVCQDS